MIGYTVCTFRVRNAPKSMYRGRVPLSGATSFLQASWTLPGGKPKKTKRVICHPTRTTPEVYGYVGISSTLLSTFRLIGAGPWVVIRRARARTCQPRRMPRDP